MNPGRSVDMTGIDLGATLGSLALLPGDPSVRVGDGRFERATVTPSGPGVITVRWTPDRPGRAEVTAAGDGADWLLERAPRLLGCEDDVTGFAPADRRVRQLWERHPGLRVGATGTLWHDLAWTIVQQRISRLDAARQWRQLVLGLGTPAASGGDGLVVPPAPRTVARLTYPQLHRFGIERRRAETLIRAGAAVLRMEELVDGPVAAGASALGTISGVGPWTISCLAAFTWGAADTVVLGDVGIPSMVTWMLAGEPRGDDARMAELLRPYRPHRYRIVQLAFASRSFPPKRTHRGTRTDVRRL